MDTLWVVVERRAHAEALRRRDRGEEFLPRLKNIKIKPAKVEDAISLGLCLWRVMKNDTRSNKQFISYNSA